MNKARANLATLSNFCEMFLLRSDLPGFCSWEYNICEKIAKKIAKKYRQKKIEIFFSISRKKNSVEIFHMMNRLRGFRGSGDDIRADGQTDSVQNLLYRLIVH